MKAEIIQMIVNEVPNLDMVKIIIESLNHLAMNDIRLLLQELKNCGYNKSAYRIATDSDVLKKRTTEEQVRLIEVLKNCEYNEYAYGIVVDPNVLEKRTTEDQIRLMETFKSCDYNEYAYGIVVDPNVLEKRTTEDQIRLIETLKNCDYIENACHIAVDSTALITKTITEQIECMQHAYEQSKMQQEEQQKVYLSENIKNIETLEEMKNYIDYLIEQNGKDADIEGNTLVYKYQSNREENK